MEFRRSRPAGTKAEVVFSELRDRLIAGERAYGTTLSTAGLAEEFEVSRRPVMDAIMRLEQAGFIEIIPQVGCRVIVPERESVMEHFYAQAVIEGAAARLAAEKASRGEDVALRGPLQESAGAAQANDVPAFELANKRLHAAILSAAGNRRLDDLAVSSWALSDFYLQRRTPQDLLRSHAEHDAIVEAIEAGDESLARELMEAHLTRFGREALIPESLNGRVEAAS